MLDNSSEVVNTSSTATPLRPVALTVRPDGIPTELKLLAQWVLWRYTWKDGRWTKLPLRPNGRTASSTNPATWSTFDTVVAAYRAGGWDGIGLIHLHTDRITGIDLDHCGTPDTGSLEPWAADIVAELDTYTETSPSGSGVRAYTRGVKPGRRCRKGQLELYDGLTKEGKQGGRFLTITGCRLTNYSGTVNDRQQQIDSLYRRTFGQQTKNSNGFHATTFGGDCPLPLDAAELARWKCLGSDKADRIRALWSGDISYYKGDESAADQGLCNFLFVLTNGDRHRSEQLFGDSVLGKRIKWTRRQDYRELTLDTSAEWFTPWHDDPAGRNGKATPLARMGGAGQPGVAIILDYFRDRYRPDFKRGNVIHCEDGREVPMGEACAVPTSPLIERLARATDAPKFKNGELNRGALPGYFAKWAKVAWGDLLESLPDEDEAELGHDAEAAEEFRRLVRDALLTEVVLGDTIADTGVTQTERRSLIEWCYKFAREGPWRSIRSKRCWCKTRLDAGGELVLMVAIRHELFAQLRASPRLCAMGANRFGRRAERYGVGSSSEADRPHGRRAVILADDFVADLLESLPDDDPEICRAPKPANDPAEGRQNSETTK
jgi:hypothetical protein